MTTSIDAGRKSGWKNFAALKRQIWNNHPEGRKQDFTPQERAEIYRDVLLCHVGKGNGDAEEAIKRLGARNISISTLVGIIKQRFSALLLL